MNKKMSVGPGAASLMLVLLVLIMSVMGLLSIMSAKSDMRLSERTRDAVVTVCKLKTDAEKKLIALNQDDTAGKAALNYQETINNRTLTCEFAPVDNGYEMRNCVITSDITNDPIEDMVLK